MGNITNNNLGSATQSALSGMQASGKKIANIANNIANAKNEDYSAKRIDVSSVNLNGAGGGVSTGVAYRTVNEVFVEDFRIQGQKAAYCETLEGVYKNLDQRFGRPNDERSLRGCVQSFANAASALATSPTSQAQLQGLLLNAKNLTTELNSMSNLVQSLRQNCDQAIDTSVREINKNLMDIQTMNAQIMQNKISNRPIGDYQDQRDASLRTLSSYLDITTHDQQSFKDSGSQSGMIDITTKDGFGLLQANTPKPLSFTPTAAFDATLTSAAVITINGQDITPQIHSGSLAANIQLRDIILPNLQNDLDTLASQLRDSVNKIHNEGSGFPGAQSLTGQRTFTTGGSTPFTGSGVVRVALLDQTTGNYLQAQDFNLATASTLDDVITGLNTASGGGNIEVKLNASNQLVISSTLANGRIAIGSVGGPATETMTGQSLGFSHYCGMNDFFTTGSQVIQDGTPLNGLAKQISVRPDIASQPALIARGQLNTALTGPIPPNALPTQPGILAGSDQIIRGISQALTQTMTLPASGNLASRTSSLTDYAQDILGFQARTIKANQDELSTQNQQLQLAQKNVTDTSSVSLQEEITNLLAEQKLYNVSSMVVKIVNDLMDKLLAIR